MSKIDLIVLGLLMEQPMHGYKIVSFFEKRGLVMWTRVKSASVYKALQRLEKEGNIRGEMKQEENNPPKKVFTLTENGREKFRTILRHYLFCKDETVSPIDFWNALRFVHQKIPRTEFLRALENHEKWLQEHVEKMQQKQREALDCGNPETIPFYGRIMIEAIHRIKDLEFDTIQKIKTAALLPENQADFAFDTIQKIKTAALLPENQADFAEEK